MANSISDYLHNYKVRVFDNLGAPRMSAVSEGVSGSTLYEYRASFKTIVGESLPSDIVRITSGNATLSGFNKNKLSVLEIPAAVTKVRYWKNAWTYYTQTLRENTTVYTTGQYMVIGSNSQVRYQCTSSGTSHTSDPGSWPTTLGDTKTDGNVVWTAVTNKNDNWVLLGEVDPDPGQLYDTGQTTTVATVPSTDTSGRPGVIAILPKPGTMIQRAERIDYMSLMSQMVQDGFDLIHNSGDVISGCSEYSIGNNIWGFNPGKIYFLGRFIDVPGGQITLTGSGEEKVGLVVSPLYETPDDDYVWRCGEDEGVAGEYANTGPDVMYFQVTWVKDIEGMLLIKEFINGQPKKVTLSPERTALEIFVADKIKDLAGDFVVDKFPMEVVDHDSDETKLYLSVKRGKAYPNGFKTVIEGSRNIPFDKARETRIVNSGIIDPFQDVGAVNAWNYWTPATEITVGTIIVPPTLNGYRYEATATDQDDLTGLAVPDFSTTPGETTTDNHVTWTCLGNDYDLSGLTLSVKVGEGTTREVTFVSNNMSASAVISAIEAVVNAEANLVEGTSDTAILQLRAVAAKPITLSGTAIAKLAWVSGTTQTSGARIYSIADPYIKRVFDLNYNTEVVLTVNRSTINSYDDLGDGLALILGASDSLADCHDGIYDYVVNTDFFKVGDTISFSGISGTPPTAGNDYYVKCRKNYNAVPGVRQLVTVTNAPIVRSDQDTDTITFGGTKVRNVTGDSVTLSGNAKHVVKILRVTNTTNNTETDYSSYILESNSDGDSHGISKISWANAGEDQPLLGATYYVTYEVWNHAVEGDYVTADSYDVYDRIEVYSNKLLRDCVDFRTTSTAMPVPDYATIFDYEHYLPRIDKLLVDDFGNFFLIKGVAAVNPTIPNDQVGRMTLAILNILPYTYSTKSVTITSLEPVVIKQSSMKSILHRLDQLEYWKAVTDLEDEVASSTVSTDAVGLYTNALTGFNKFDLNFKGLSRVGSTDNVEVIHTAALDLNKQCLLLAASAQMKEIELDDAESDGVKRVGNTLMLDYTPELFLEQPYATESVSCAIDYDFDSYRGTLSIFPVSDVFIDKNQLPTVNVDFQNNLQPLVTALIDQGALRLNETVWGNWNTSYSDHPFAWAAPYYNRPGGGYDFDLSQWGDLTGTPYEGYTRYADYMFDYYYDQWVGAFGYGNRYDWGYGYTAGYTEQRRWRDGVERNLIPGTQTQSLGSAIVDLSMAGKVRTTYDDGSPFIVQVEAMNLVPNQDHALTIANVPVNFTYDSSPAGGTARGSSGDAGHTYQSKTTVKSDNTGRLTGKFIMPAGIDAGNLSIQVFFYNDPSVSNASAYFSSAGFVQKERETTIGLPTFSYCTTAVHEENTRRVYDNYYDPLAQTFVVYDDIKYISEVGIFFRTKSNTLPIRLEVRGTTNGEPNSTILAQSIVEAADVVISEDGTAETIFELDTVVGYRKDTEFALALFPALNNTDYTVWTAKVGGVDVNSGVLVSTQTNDGVLFHSPNSRVWEPMTKQDLKFKLYKCNFVEDAAFIFKNITGINASSFVMAIEEFAAPGTEIKWFYRPYWTDNSPEDNDWVPFYPNIDTFLETTLKRVDLKGNVTSFGGSYQLVNPLSGIVLMMHKPSNWVVCPNEDFADSLNLPNTVKCYVNLNTDLTGPLGARTGRTVTPYFSFDNGATLVEIQKDPDVTPTAVNGVYYKYTFSTPPQATIESTANATVNGPIVCTSTGHKFMENAKVFISGVSGDANANGTFVIRGVTDNTFSLYHVTTKQPIIGSGAGTGGTVKMADIDRLRPFVKLETSNTVRTPRVMDLAFIASKA